DLYDYYKEGHAEEDFSARHGSDHGAAIAGGDGSGRDAIGQNTRHSGAPARFRFHADGLRYYALDPAQRKKSRPAFANSQFAGPGPRTRHGDHKSGAAKRLSRHARDFQRRFPERGEGEVD